MPSSTTSSAARRRVAFSGADVIEYDAALAPVVRLCGVPSAAADAALECQARGVATVPQLVAQYTAELQHAIRARGFQPMSDDLQTLQTQHHVIELLYVWTAVGVEAHADATDVATLRRARLATKLLDGRVDDGYAFGRRFFAVPVYVESLSAEEVVQAAEARNVSLQQLDEQQKAAVKALDRELVGCHGTAEGRPLRSLTWRQLMEEAQARGLAGKRGDAGKDSKGKKSKRAWVDELRPVLIAEVRAAKIQEQEELLLRARLTVEMEREQERKQQQRLVQIIEAMVPQAVTKDGDEASGADCVEPEGDDVVGRRGELVVGDERQGWEKGDTRTFLAALAKTLCIPRDCTEDVDMEK
ncbi:unnamed protein product [Hyaloperonospora brassicae]|uniref:Uncharacterized protein n=1 Tax=Hyaloperonospora brassicae TaxID=162125 RepID=A0AAV0T873_HYABA|nr:unnamed protein product [Hyaloperonospora brassicae]